MSEHNFSGFSGKTVLVTGGAGFIGSSISRRLLSLGAKVICVDNLSTGKRENVADLEANPQYTFIVGDCNRREDLWPVFVKEHPDFVYHYAAVVGVKRTVEHPLWVLNDLQGIKNVFELAAISGTKKVVFSSSSEAYGEPVELPEREDGIHNAKFPYALVKLIGEQYGAAMKQEHGLRFTALRFFNTYGPGQESSDYGFVAGIFMRQVLSGQSPTIFGDGLQTRDFVYVQDNLDVALAVMLSEACDGEVINVGAGRQTTIKELAETVIKISGKDLKPVHVERRTDGEILHRRPDVSKCKQLLGFTPSTSLEDGLRITYAWYKDRYGDRLVTKKRVLIFSLSYVPFMSGAERFVQEVGKRLSVDTPITLITARFRRDLPVEETLDGMRVIRVGFGTSFDKFLFPFLCAWKARTIDADIVHAVMESYAGIALMIYRKFRPQMPTILTLQSGSITSARVRAKVPDWLLRTIHTVPHKIHSISQALAERARAYGAKDADLVIPNGADLERFFAAKGTPKTATQLVSVGRLHSDKAFDVLIRAMALVHKKRPAVTLSIAGEGEDRSALTKLIQELDLAKVVRLLGNMEYADVPKFMAGAAVFVCPSRAEGLGNVFVEAQAVGTAVIGTRVGGIPDVIEDDVSGVLVPPEDPEALATAIIELVDHPEQRERLERAAADRLQRYSWNLIAHQIDELYVSMLKKA